MATINRGNPLKMSYCPVCGKPHQAIKIYMVEVIKCELMQDLIYLNGVTLDKESRLMIKEELGL